MAQKKVWLGSTGPFLYDDAVLYIDEEGVISPDNQQAIATDGQIVIQSPPSSPVHAVRKQDLDDALGDISGLESRVDALETADAALGTMSMQNANAVAITGGNAVLTGLGLGTAVSGFYRLSLHWDKTAGRGILMHQLNSDSGYEAVLFENTPGSPVGSITTTVSSVAYNTTSDSRLKKDITPLTGALDVVRALKPITHRWRADDSPGVGFLASEVQEVIPDGVITGDRDAVDEEGRIMPQMIDYSKLVPWLVGSVQALAEQVGVLQAQISGLEHQLGL